jgi:hypothetical protein
VPIAPFLPVIEHLRTLPTQEVTVSSINLVELRRAERAYRFETLSELQLGFQPER